MIEIDNTLITDDLRDSYFVCDLNRCKGACCVEGDLGAPLEDSELEVIESLYPEIEPYLSEKGKRQLPSRGLLLRIMRMTFQLLLLTEKNAPMPYMMKTQF